MHGVTIFVLGAFMQQPLVAGADIGIGIRFIAEVFASEEAAIALIIDWSLDRNMRHHARRFAVSDLFSIGVAGAATIWKLSTPSALFAASAIGWRQRLSAASST